MKSLKNIIFEKLKINKDSKSKIDIESIFKQIDAKDFKWNAAYGDENYQDLCKVKVNDLANKIYKNLNVHDRLEQLFKDSYKQYLMSQCWALEKIDKQYNSQIEIINKYSWSHFEYFSLEPGWWAFMYWVYKKINI